MDEAPRQRFVAVNILYLSRQINSSDDWSSTTGNKPRRGQRSRHSDRRASAPTGSLSLLCHFQFSFELLDVHFKTNCNSIFASIWVIWGFCFARVSLLSLLDWFFLSFHVEFCCWDIFTSEPRGCFPRFCEFVRGKRRSLMNVMINGNQVNKVISLRKQRRRRSTSLLSLLLMPEWMGSFILLSGEPPPPPLTPPPLPLPLSPGLCPLPQWGDRGWREGGRAVKEGGVDPSFFTESWFR